jgi:hypothetical protein
MEYVMLIREWVVLAKTDQRDRLTMVMVEYVMPYYLVFPCVALPKGVELRDNGGICCVRGCSFGIRFQCPCKCGAMIAGLWITVLLGDRLV